MKILVVAVLAAAGLAGCNLLQQLEGGGSGGSSASGAGGATTVGEGSNCGVDPDTGATLCLGNSTCPGLTIDTAVFPACGYRVAGALVDIECSCGNSLCSLGATSCSTAQVLLTQLNEGAVCAKLSAGTCTVMTPVATTTSSSSGGSGTCDTTCRDECGGAPDCIQACGC